MPYKLSCYIFAVLGPTAGSAKIAGQGAVWAGDVNDDGTDEYIVDDGGMPGTLGPVRFLVQLYGEHWRALACLGSPEAGEKDCESEWNTLRARFDILPAVRQGYHDLRIEVDHCLKWDGYHCVDYDMDDYAKLPMGWFDSSDSHEAELFWKIRYGERNVLQFEPMWFPISREEFGKPPRPYIGFPVRVVEFPKLPYVACADPGYDLRWLSFFRGGVWGVRGDRAFLLVPQPSYLGAQQMELDGDWLLIYGQLEEPQGPPTVRYNRRTHELRFEIEQQCCAPDTIACCEWCLLSGAGKVVSSKNLPGSTRRCLSTLRT
jgi:hypothetical protein